MSNINACRLNICNTPYNLKTESENNMHHDELHLENQRLKRLLEMKDEEILKLSKANNHIVKLVININDTDGTSLSKKYQKKKITHAVKLACWNTHVGELVAKTKCLCCKQVDITQHNFHCGHVTAECKGGTLEVSNLRPICNVCNTSMGSTNMFEYMAEHGFGDDLSNQLPTTSTSHINQPNTSLSITPSSTKTNFVCERCGHDAKTKQNLITHLRKQKPCSSIDNTSVRAREDIVAELVGDTIASKIHVCKHCNKKYTSEAGREKHKKTCPKNPDMLLEKKVDILLREVAELKKEREVHYRRVH